MRVLGHGNVSVVITDPDPYILGYFASGPSYGSISDTAFLENFKTFFTKYFFLTLFIELINNIKHIIA